MKLNLRTKDKILNTLLVISEETNTTEIKNFSKYVNRFDYISKADLYRYLKLLEYEHIIDLDYYDEEISSILLMPSAYIYFSEKRQSNVFTYVNIVLSAIAAVAAVMALLH